MLLRRKKWMEHAAYLRELRNIYGTFIRELHGKKPHNISDIG
jgi:hypothetical protein